MFLATAFDFSPTRDWHMVATVYRRDGDSGLWDWNAASADVPLLREWLRRNRHRLAGVGFGNHRKFESLNDQIGVGKTIASHVSWVLRAGSHQARFDIAAVTADPFDSLFRSMDGNWRFGRLARFDYLCCLEAFGITDFAPRKAYMQNATGPLEGARRMFGAPQGVWAGRPLQLDERLIELEDYLDVGFDVLEDALCGWQKHPSGLDAEPCGVRGTLHSCTSARKLPRHC